MTIFRPVILEADGVFGQLINGGITNIGGVAGPTFTVAGQGLLFDDGTSTDGGVGLTLQKLYDNSFPAGIKLATGNDFSIYDDTDNSLFFRIDSETGKVTITGDLEVLGSSSVIVSTITDADHWLISPKDATTIALKIEPDPGVTPLVDLISVRKQYGGTPVFRIDATGNIHASQNLTVLGDINVNGTVDGVDVAQLKSDFDNHGHVAAAIQVSPIPQLPGVNNVQQALEQLAVSGGGGGPIVPGNVNGYEHIQAFPSNTWNVQHNTGTFRAQVTIYNASWEQLIPDSVKVVDANNVLVTFAAPIDGRALVVTF